MLNILSWNVNGIRACLKKGFEDAIREPNPDIVCLQETKCQAETQPTINLDGLPFHYFHFAEQKGYSGTAVFTKHEPQRAIYHAPPDQNEGRLMTLEYPEFYLVNAYVPNSGDGLKRLQYRIHTWEPSMREYLNELRQLKPVVYCGDLNVAHREIDIANPQRNRRSAGFTNEERQAFDELLQLDFVDSFRHFYPDTEGAYSWWSYRAQSRERNVGWRIDYVLLGSELLPALKEASIHQEIHGSDHCPVSIVLDL